MVFISLTTRILLNIEALNMTESVGNFIRHRRAPVIISSNNGYLLKYVPVISGESLAHAYQEVLAKIASEPSVDIKVCKLCKEGVLVKHTDKSIFNRTGIQPSNITDPIVVEKAIVENCVVEDIGGFLYTDAALKRTSRVYFGYMIPAMDAIRLSATEAQFHVRYDQPVGGGMTKQMIYNVETGSALYVLNSLIDLCGIGVSSINGSGIISIDERMKRAEIAIKALELMITQQLFGAKRTRFYPDWRIMSLLILVSSPIQLNPIPAHDINFVKQTVESVSEAVNSLNSGEVNLNEKASIFYYAEEKIEEPDKVSNIEIVRVNNPVEAFVKARETALELFKNKCGGKQ
ncbi:MAG: type I-A CRISPR-associated protein Cas7/Csa2 [Thermosphaera sp.]